MAGPAVLKKAALRSSVPRKSAAPRALLAIHVATGSHILGAAMSALPRRAWKEMTTSEFASLDRERVIAVLPV